MAITELTRTCSLCHRPLPDPPAPAVCGACGYVEVAHHTQWAPALKWWLISELCADSRACWKSDQAYWEDKLRTVMNGTSLTKPNPWGLPVSMSTPPVELYPLALERVGWWRASGSPIATRILTPGD
jgi:hypothetical protein